MNDLFETDGALRAEFSEIENKKLNKIKADAIREAVDNTVDPKYALPLRDACELYDYADKIERGE